jgi:ATP-dependent Zn protease
MRSPEVKRACAIHEAGHAVTAVALGLEVESVSIRTGRGTGGTTSVISSDPIPTRDALERDVIVGLAGRAADEVIGTGCNIGGIGDLAKSTRILAAMHASYGLGSTLTHRIDSDRAAELLGSDLALASRIELDLRRLYRRTVNVIQHHRSAILAVAEALLGHYTLTGDDVARIVLEADTAMPKGMRAKSSPVGMVTHNKRGSSTTRRGR